MARLSEIIAQLDDDVKKMSYYDICSAINSCDTEDQSSFEAKAEIIGMSFVEDAGNKEWGCYYGPKLTWTEKDMGEMVYMPDMADITSEYIEYWTKRAAETKNPLLKMRYTGLVWEFGKRVTGKDPDFKDIKQQFIISSVETVEQDLAEYAISGLTYSKRAIEKSISIRNTELTGRCIKAMLAYQTRYEKDDLAGIWGPPFRIMMEHIEFFGKFESDMLKAMLDRFERIESQCNGNGQESNASIHTLKAITELLADYYVQKHDIGKIKEYLDRYHACLVILYDSQGAMWSHGMIQGLQNLYRKCNLSKDANRLYLEIQSLASRILAEMKPVQISVPIDNEQIEKYFKPLLEGSAEEVLTNYMLKYLINLDDERKKQKEEAEQSPLMDMIRTVVYNQAGMPINNIGVGERAEEQKFSYGIYRRMLISSFFVKIHIQKMKIKEIYTYDMVMNLFKNSPLILDSQRPLLEKGMNAYFEQDYIVACHLLVPLFEDAIRVLAASNGHEVLRPNADPQEGNEYISLDRLLDEIESDNDNLKNIVVYFKNVFTDKFGWNTRNLLCHGVLPASAFNDTLADRVVHAFLLLSLFKLINKEDDSTNVTEEAK